MTTPCAIYSSFGPLGPPSDRGAVEMGITQYLQSNEVDLSSETCPMVANCHAYVNGTIFGTEIDHCCHQIWHPYNNCTLPLGRARVNMTDMALLAIIMVDFTYET